MHCFFFLCANKPTHNNAQVEQKHRQKNNTIIMSLKGLGAAFVLTLGSFAITYEQPQKISLFAKDRKAATEGTQILFGKKYSHNFLYSP